MSKRSSRQREKRPIEEPRSQTARAPEGEHQRVAASQVETSSAVTAPTREHENIDDPGSCQEPRSPQDHSGANAVENGSDGRTLFDLTSDGVGLGPRLLVADASPEDGGEARRARVRLRAADVDSGDKDAMIDFCKTLGEDYEKGETDALLAEVWGLSLSTVSRHLSSAWREIRQESDPEWVKGLWWRESAALLEAAKADREMVAEAAHSMRGALGPAELKFVSDALGRSVDSVSKPLEMVGKASGLISTKPNAPLVVVNVGGKPERIDASEVARFAERAHAFMAERHPELVAEFLEYVGAGDVPALTVGGGQ